MRIWQLCRSGTDRGGARQRDAAQVTIAACEEERRQLGKAWFR